MTKDREDKMVTGAVHDVSLSFHPAAGQSNLHSVSEIGADTEEGLYESSHPPEAPAEGGSDDSGLTDVQVEKLREKFGYNEVTAKSEPVWLQILKRYAQLTPVILGVTAVFAAAVPEPSGRRDWITFGLLVFLINLVVYCDFFGDRNAKNAMKVVEDLSAPTANVKRNGQWETLKVRLLVPGDVVALKGGTVIPADGKLIGNPQDEPLSVDESSLTGESLAVTKWPGDECLSGAVVLRGELRMRVTNTGANSFFGKTVGLLGDAEKGVGHLRSVLYLTAKVITVVGAVFCLALFLADLFFETTKPSVAQVFLSLKLALVVLAAIVPAAMPVVTTTVLAVGATILAKEKAVVTRLSAIEEMAGLEVLCSDKTGTLTKNELSLDRKELVCETGVSADRLLLLASLASVVEHPEPIDKAINEAAAEGEGADARESYKSVKFTPFNPVDKRSMAVVKGPDGSLLRICKGAPHVVRDMVVASLKGDVKQKELERLDDVITSKAVRGLRTLGVCVQTLPEPSRDPMTDPKVLEETALSPDSLPWKLAGYISLLDPPRDDTAETIRQAIGLGVDVKMVTGDQLAIAIETARRLDMGTNILGNEVWKALPGGDVNAKVPTGDGRVISLSELCLSSDGFAGVYPEHKFKVVESIAATGRHVGMTGDGVNDAPALKLATVGVAVAGATEAAKAAADIVLMAPGLSTIVTAMKLSRQIFRRVEEYIIYRIASSVLILMFFFFALVGFRFLMPAWVLILLSIINDFTLMTSSRDRVPSSPTPLIWDMPMVCVAAFTVGTISSACSLVLLYLAAPHFADWWHLFGLSSLSSGQVVAAVYLNISIGLQLNFLAARTQKVFAAFDGKGAERPALLVAGMMVVALLLSTMVAVYWPRGLKLGGGVEMEGCSWAHAGVVWAFSVVQFLFVDMLKWAAYSGYFALFPHKRRGGTRDDEALARRERRRAIAQRREKEEGRGVSVGKDEELVGDDEDNSHKWSWRKSAAAREARAVRRLSRQISDQRLDVERLASSSQSFGPAGGLGTSFWAGGSPGRASRHEHDQSFRHGGLESVVEGNSRQLHELSARIGGLEGSLERIVSALERNQIILPQWNE
uniref:Plasma membrane ATPase n=1 Tax=Chromera velia CCMP2878 TaxID=1169474 RepID=A0A0G4HM51_9ALVE|eukprot:Cvel_7442.t1-p1 / transcript=Cvel_7442.t1 / gene=Cvel_7442 / organism=Chromera_velia_CCMP2878 / gene_product=ATPase 3, plasma membrane-type, putative / transcript_product=ATPase 3, plasma membrane-type, putative / location=Cvel_scaffold389:16926-21263(-) / protein_length=1096 / sequence_SO=supercontig / SO=protein_coding / is_pseudo=false